jgi:hypothetical protein
MGATAGVASGDEADDSGSFDDALADDETSSREDVAAGSALEPSAETMALPGSPGTAAADLNFELPPAPVNNGTISWTGLAPAEPALEAATTTPIETTNETTNAAPIEAAVDRPAQVEPTTSEVAVVAPEATNTTEATDAAATATEAAEPTEKKVVWSSSPSERYTSFGSGPRRDDY